MSADVVPLFRPSNEADPTALIAALSELHALISLDPVAGVSAARAYFVVSPPGMGRVRAALGPADARARPHAYALVAYDFPFALAQFQLGGSAIAPERVKAIVTLSGALQGESLVRAAEALGLEAIPAREFDAVALKASFFAQTQETVTHVVRLTANAAV